MTFVKSLGRGGVGWTIGLCLAATLVEGFDIQSTGIVAPQYRAEFNLSHSQQGLLFGFNNLGLFIGSVISGWGADRLGRRWMAILTMAGFGVFSIACAMAQTGDQFTLLRFCLGLGLGGSLANIIALTSEAGSVERRVVRVTVMSAGIAVGGAIPGVILSALPDLNWRIIYQIGGWLPLVVGLMMLAMLQESAPYLRAKEQSQTDSHAIQGSAFPALFKDGRASATTILWIATFCTFLVYYLINNWLPSLLVARHFSTRQASIAAVLFTGGGALGTVLLGAALGFASRRAITLFIFIGTLVALIGLSVVGQTSWTLPVVFVLGFFVTTAKNLLYGLAPLFYPVYIRGTGVGAAVGVGRVGSVVGPMVAGMAMSAKGDGSVVLLGSIPVLVIAAGACIALATARTAPPD